MSDVFISYAREDKPKAELFAKALGQQGKGDGAYPEFQQFLEAVRMNVGQGGSPTKPIPTPTFETDKRPTGGDWRAELVASAKDMRTIRIHLSRGSQIIEYHHNYKTGEGPIIVDSMTVVGGEPLLELFGLKFPLLVRCSQ